MNRLGTLIRGHHTQLIWCTLMLILQVVDFLWAAHQYTGLFQVRVEAEVHFLQKWRNSVSVKNFLIESNINHSSQVKQKKEFPRRIVGRLIES